jgi:DHA2 family multidrug resistance protein
MSQGAFVPGESISFQPISRPVISVWILALIVVIPTFMEVLDSTIVNVALRQIAGGLQAAANDSQWTVTSYLAANATILPISGWISERLGRRNYFLLSIGIFTLCSALCGFSTNLGQLIFFRVVQGLAGGGLQPMSQGILFDIFPKEKQGVAMTIFGVAALVAPVLGPTLGGFLSDTYSWRYIFYINIPVGIAALVACSIYLQDPEYLQKEHAEMKKNPSPFDTLGLMLLSITMVCWEVVNTKGQEWDWFGDPFWRVQGLLALFIVALVSLIYRERRISHPILNFKPLADKNFLVCSVIIFMACAVLYGSVTILPTLLESLINYNALNAGLVVSPSGIFAILTMLGAGIAMSRQVDTRLLIGLGLAVMAIGCLWTSKLNLLCAPINFVGPNIVITMGISLIFAPINVAAFYYIPVELRASAIGLFALLRNEGGSWGTSAIQTILDRREQFHSLRVNEYLDNFNPAVVSYLNQMTSYYRGENYGPVLSKEMAWQSLSNLRTQQADGLANFDCFWVMGVVALILIPGIYFMKRAISEKGAMISAG